MGKKYKCSICGKPAHLYNPNNEINGWLHGDVLVEAGDSLDMYYECKDIWEDTKRKFRGADAYWEDFYGIEVDGDETAILKLKVIPRPIIVWQGSR